MTKDCEADSIADETRRDVERRTQSPYTRDEFIGAESDRWRKLNPYQSDDVDIPMEAVMAAAAAERAGITWRVDNICPTCQCNQGWERCINGRTCLSCGGFMPDTTIRCPECDELCRSFDLDGRGVCMRHGVVERPTTRRSDDDLAGRISALEQQVARPIVAEIHDPTGARTVYHAIEERTKDEIRTLIRETVFGGPLSTSVGQNLLQRVGALEQKARELYAEHDRRLTLQLERTTELTNSVHSLQQTVKVIRERLYENVTDDADYGLLEQVQRIANKLDDAHDLATSTWNSLHSKAFRDEVGSPGLIDVVHRLDADMALIRDAVCPPQGAAVGGIDADRADELLRKLGRADALFDINGTRVWGERNVDDIRDLLHVYGHKPVAYAEDAASVESTQVSVDDPSYRERVEVAHLDDIVASALHEQYEWVDTLNGLRYLAGAAGVQVDDNRKGWTPSLHPEPVMRLELIRLGVLVDKYADALRAACLELGADAAWSDDTNLADVVSKVLMPAMRQHDDLAFALGRAYVALKGLEPYEPRIADEEMEAIRRVLGNNYRDWLRPREAE